MNAGKPSRRSFQSISVTSDIIRKPTSTNAPQVAAELTIEMRGAMNAAAIKSRPVKIEERPVRPPSAAPDADSIKVVMEEAPKKPPAAAAAESTIRICLMSLTLPSSVRKSPCLAIAIAEPMVSKKSDIIKENAKTRRTGVVSALTIPITPALSVKNGAPKVEKSRPETMPVGLAVTPRGIPASTARIMPISREPLTRAE